MLANASARRAGWWRSVLLGVLGTLALVMGCSDTASKDGGSDPYYNEFGVDPFGLEPPMGKADSAGVPGPGTSLDDGDTQVWKVKNQWEDRNTAAAKEAGMAWPANSGLNWDEKYSAWIDGMKKVPAESSWGGETFEFVTPFGKTLKSPKLECAEVAMFMRLAFASWYNLPFYMTTTDAKGTRVFFGHMGAVTASGRYQNMPLYKSYYKDYSDMAPSQYGANWPKDQKLREKGLYGGGDDMDYIAPGAKAGTYFDEVFLNKRVGHFALHLLSYFGSINVASSRNTYNLKPASMREGDVLVERWQKEGIGHTLLVKSVTPLEGGRFDAQLASGSMPRRQPKWEDAVSSKYTFTNDYTGGPGYGQFGGGLKRWRVAKNWQGKWTNSWMNADEASWINDSDIPRIESRIEEFKNILGEVSPEQLRTALVAIVEDARTHLRQYPASCSAREKRENAFRELYSLNQQKFSMSPAETDAAYRKMEDYAFAELVYDKSKTCCWNSTTNDMYKIIMDYEQSLQQNACTPPVVFKASNGGNYQVFADYAASTGRADQWKAWSEDEPCAQKTVNEDTESSHSWAAFCSLSGGGGTGGTGGAGGTGGTGGSGNAGGTGGTGGSSSGASCVGHCGESTAVPGSNPPCYCDSYCTQNGDCCADKVAACG